MNAVKLCAAWIRRHFRKKRRRCRRKLFREEEHGWWVIERSSVEAEIKCSECGYSYIEADSYARAEYNYCPQCGAKMDGE